MIIYNAKKAVRKGGFRAMGGFLNQERRIYGTGNCCETMEC